MLTIDEREITGPGTGAHPEDGASSFRRILVPARHRTSPARRWRWRRGSAASPAVSCAWSTCRPAGLVNGDSYSLHVKGAKASGTVSFSCEPPRRDRADLTHGYPPREPIPGLKGTDHHEPHPAHPPRAQRAGRSPDRRAHCGRQIRRPPDPRPVHVPGGRRARSRR